MIPNQIRSFINEIILKTENDTAKWKILGEGTFALRSKNATVEVGYFIDEEQECRVHTFRYRNLKNNANVSFNVTNFEDDWFTMERLYTVASASANNIGKELTDFLENLEE